VCWSKADRCSDWSRNWSSDRVERSSARERERDWSRDWNTDWSSDPEWRRADTGVMEERLDARLREGDEELWSEKDRSKRN